MNDKSAALDHQIHELISARWSPYAFSDKSVSKADICSIFEAARWAPSSYNEQPWIYIVASKEMTKEYEQVLSCLVEANQVWAKAAPVLALGVISLKFARNGNPNRAAAHDLGLASGTLTTEATARGLYVHQMIGISQEKAREVFSIPDGYEAWTALAIGYKGDSNNLPDGIKERDFAPRQRKPLSEFVYSGKWGKACELIGK